MNTFWANTKQTFKEKLGKNNDSSESPELKDRTRKLEESRKYLKFVYKGLLRETKTATQAIEEGREVAGAFHEYATRLQLNRESGKLAAALKQTGDVSVQFSELHNTLNGYRVNEVLVPLRDLVIGEIREARYAKKRFDKVRSSYDAALNTVRNLESKANVNELKLNEARQYCEEQRLRFREASYNTLDLIDETDDQADCTVLDILIRFMQAYHAFFKQGLELVDEVLPAMLKHRESIEEIQRDIHKKKGNRAIQRAAELETSGEEKIDEKTRVFGVELTEIAARDGIDYPPFIDQCFDFVHNHALDVEGVFRISGASAGVAVVVKHINTGQPFDITEYMKEPHLIVGVLKAFFRKLPSPLLTFPLYHRLLETTKLRDNPQERLKAIQQLLSELPAPNKALLSSLLHCLKEVASHEGENKMGSANLAMVIAPTILYPQIQDSAQMINDIPTATSAVEFMITHCGELHLPAPRLNKASTDGSSQQTTWATAPNMKRSAEGRSLRGAALKGSGAMLSSMNASSTDKPSATASLSALPPLPSSPGPSAKPPVPKTEKPLLPRAGSAFGSNRSPASPATPPPVPTRNLEDMQKRAAILDKRKAHSVAVPAIVGKVPIEELEFQDSRKIPGWSKAIPKVYKQPDGGGGATTSTNGGTESNGNDSKRKGSEESPPTEGEEHPPSSDSSDSDTEDHLTDSDTEDEDHRKLAASDDAAHKGGITMDFGD